MGVSTSNNQEFIRLDVWSQEIKEILQEELMADAAVNWISDFPDGNEIHIPSLSELNVRPYVEGDEVVLDDISTGEFTLTIDKYYNTGFIIYDKFKQDSFYINQVKSKFVQGITRALMEQKEADIFGLQSKQTASDPNNINSFAHRVAGSGTGGAIAVQDIAKAKVALDKANVPKTGRVAFVDPISAYQLVTVDQVIRQDVYGNNARLKEGTEGQSFLGRYLGFDFYESNFLDTDSGLTNIDGTVSVTDPVYNVFAGTETFIGAMRLQPELESWRVPEKKGDAYDGTMRYGIDLYRPESLVVLGTKSTI